MFHLIFTPSDPLGGFHERRRARRRRRSQAVALSTPPILPAGGGPENCDASPVDIFPTAQTGE